MCGKKIFQFMTIKSSKNIKPVWSKLFARLEVHPIVFWPCFSASPHRFLPSRSVWRPEKNRTSKYFNPKPFESFIAAFCTNLILRPWEKIYAAFSNKNVKSLNGQCICFLKSNPKQSRNGRIYGQKVRSPRLRMLVMSFSHWKMALWC